MRKLYKGLPVKFVSKGWGYESHIVNKSKYCGKILFFKKGKKCSWHKHLEKEEDFYVHEGKLKVWWSFDDIVPVKESEENGLRGIEILEVGDTFFVPTGMRHQMMGLLDTCMYEFSTQHFEEDSIRIIKGD